MKCCRRRWLGFDDDEALLAAEQKLATEREESRVDDARHGGAEVHDEAWRSAGDFDGYRRHHHGHLRDGDGDPACAQAGCVARRSSRASVIST